MSPQHLPPPSLTLRRTLTDTLGWGLLLWLTGYALSLALFALVPVAVLGWFVLAPLVPLTAVVARVRLAGSWAPRWYPVAMGATWTSIAVVLDYLFIVTAFQVQAYYDIDLGLYYLSTLVIPILIGATRAPERQQA